MLNAGEFLAGDDIPRKSDAIIVLSGDNGRLEKGISLFKAGYAKYLILSNSEFLDIDKVLKEGIPEYSIIFENNATNTYTNALYTKKLMEQNNLKSAVLVTSEYHNLRSKYIFNKIYKDSDIKLSYATSKVFVFNPKKWWKNKESRNVLITEYLKLVRYIILY